MLIFANVIKRKNKILFSPGLIWSVSIAEAGAEKASGALQVFFSAVDSNITKLIGQNLLLAVHRLGDIVRAEYSKG